jgi:predicted metal-binding protein
MIDNELISSILKQYDCHDFKWLDPKNIVVAQWVRMKCRFGCPVYGNHLTCPPNTPSVAECKQFFNDYSYCIIIHFSKSIEKADDRFIWGQKITNNLLKLEREIFLTGYHKVIVFPFSRCNNCKECTAQRETCKNPESIRPVPEGMSVDVYSTARNCGYPIQVLKDYTDTMNRYALLMLQ